MINAVYAQLAKEIEIILLVELAQSVQASQFFFIFHPQGYVRNYHVECLDRQLVLGE
jgi:hypothetical protein